MSAMAQDNGTAESDGPVAGPSKQPSSAISSVHFAETPPLPRHDPQTTSESSSHLYPNKSLVKAQSSSPLTANSHFGQDATPIGRSPSLPSTRRSTEDRRAQSEALDRSAFRKASLVTGGYETSDSDEDDIPTSTSLSGLPEPPLSVRSSLYPHNRSPLRPLHDLPRHPSRQHSRRHTKLQEIAKPLRAEVTSSPDSSRKGKQKAENNGFAASLGLSTGMPREGLTSDQINSLLNDTDVVSALRMMNNSNLAARLSAARSDSSTSISALRGPPTTGEAATERKSPEPYIARAPPALLRDDDTQQNRARNVSDASSIAVPVMRSQSRSASLGPGSAHRRMSRTEPEGGHIAFTHPTPIAPVEEDETTEDERPMIPNGDRPETLGRELENGAADLTKSGSKRRNRLSHLFQRKAKRSSEHLSLDSRSATPRSDREDQRQREKEEHEKDLEMRRIEQERRDEELAQERRFRALTQVAAHPDSERLAFHVSSRLRAYYLHIYDGIENPPRLNLLAVIRWKHKSDEQSRLREEWEKRGGPSPNNEHQALGRKTAHGRSVLSVDGPKDWQYTIDDIIAYKEVDGKVNYFVPPRGEFSPQGSVVELNSVLRRSLDSSQPTQEEARSKTSLISGGTSWDMERRSTMSGEATHDMLSRSSSLAGKKALSHKSSHRTHQSLGAIAPGTLAHALKTPFEKLGGGKRRNGSGHHDVYESPDEAASERHKAPRRAMFNMGGSLTDEEHREFHLRDLFPKAFEGRRPAEIAAQPVDLHKKRQLELMALQAALAKEQATKQDEQDRQSRVEAENQIRKIEAEIYADRQWHLEAARRRIEQADINLADTEEAVRNYLAHSDQMSQIAKSSFDVPASFSGLEQIRKRYAQPDTIDLSDSPHNSVSPLRRQSLLRNDGRFPPSRQSSLTRRRSSSIAPPPMALFPWPKHHSLDPVTSTRLTSLQRVEATLSHAREERSMMLVARADTVRTLQGMIAQIDALMKQKDAVRKWTKQALEANRALKQTVDTLNAQVIGNSRAKMYRMRDQLIDFSLRQGAGQLFKLFYRIWYLVMWAFSWRTPTARRNLREDQKGWKGVPWRTSMIIAVVIGLSVVFYRMGDGE